MEKTSLELAGPALFIQCMMVPWDTDVFGFPVAQFQLIRLVDAEQAMAEFKVVADWLDERKVRLASCRLPHDRLRESMFLEEQHFRFVEMVLHPRLDRLAQRELPEDTLVIAKAEESDLAAIEAIAERAFGYERYHMDHRLDPLLADKRYSRWVRNSFSHPRQQLLKIHDGAHLIAFFIVEINDEGHAYWHLTAVAREWQGRGYGRRVWQAMLRRHRNEGVEYVSTTISARNIPVLNLYARLGFGFLPPEMTFHWVR
jgi:ribosomal protein S18 acetylase RimI-like enzyme